ncbi:fructose-6-phosphate aldolase [Rickettsiales bacterium]|nr:fructose-6-phosphate aldolase [Rickettsiales bacterium]MDB2550366.1 fructose-6-phosphate aldolase [Rickettsiales bacterium]
MQFFIDTANIEEIKELSSSGLVDGVTTNPSLIAKENGNFFEILQEITKIVEGPVSAEVVATDSKNMIQEGLKLAKIADNICIKLPLTMEGLKACKYFSNEGIATNVTLCFSSAQAILAAKAGASYISPFLGRLDDISHNGLDLIADIRAIYDNYPEFETEILAASIRNPIHLTESAKIGADVATIPGKVFKQLVSHPLTDKGLEIFDADWKKTKQDII